MAEVTFLEERNLWRVQRDQRVYFIRARNEADARRIARLREEARDA